ncbi:unnamed protein product [Eruca vesicaria subsp. sativa]|uniref:Uncharacterized protein n=1 Tax=Eruca vesicaria subsp. sativa TaxID=29727 RepID=A0ABC8IZL1_ERUVS|nr:unnamed protein product [Eruca vesicaria subsp. sativa]
MQTLGIEKATRYRGQSSSASSGYEEGHKEYVEITLDMNDDSISVNSLKSPKNEDPETSLLGQGRTRKNSFSVLKRIASSVSSDLRRVTSSVTLTQETNPPRRPRKSSAELALKGLKFITKHDGVAGWPGVEKKFNEITEKTSGLLLRSKFGECIGKKKLSLNALWLHKFSFEFINWYTLLAGINSEDFALALFDALARRQNITGDVITKDQLQVFWEQINDHDFDSRLRIFFDMADKDADGRLNEDEVKEIITLSASANNLNNIKKQADEYAALIMEELDPYDRGYIMVYALEVLLLQGPAMAMGDVKSKEVSILISQQLEVSHSRNLWKRLYNGVKNFVLDNWKRLWVMALWIAVMVGLFTWKFMEYRKRPAYQVMGTCVCIAKGAGETLKLNMAIVLLPVCRNTITWLRTKTKLSVGVPFDDNLNFHKVIAIAISIGVGVHATAHLACDFPRLIAADEETYKPMEQYFGVQPKSYVEFLKSVEVVTGTVMVILMTITFTLATSWFRRNKLNSLPKPLKKITGFNAFWYTHHLFVIVYTLLVVHGYYVYLIKTWYRKTTWMYLMIPMVLYLSERLVRSLRSRIEPVKILKVGLLPGDLLMLQISRPNNFRYKSGQYLYLKCSEVSSLEWHPFSITSAPGDDYLSVHIRGLGDWTNKLREKFKEVCAPAPPDDKKRIIADLRNGNNYPFRSFPKLLIDGPYGAPSQDYKNFEVVLLVGLGIGATPMISIIKDIINNLKVNIGDEEEGKGSNRSHNMVTPPSISPARKGELFRTKRAYFYWSTKEQGTFDWFKSVMDEVAEADVNNIIELHNYCTSIFEEGDARSALIKMLQSLYHAKKGRDVVSGTRVMSEFSRPKWRSIFKRIAVKHPNTRVGVFYCGAATVVKELHNLAVEFSHKTSTKFYFHKENF